MSAVHVHTPLVDGGDVEVDFYDCDCDNPEIFLDVADGDGGEVVVILSAEEAVVIAQALADSAAGRIREAL